MVGACGSTGGGPLAPGDSPCAPSAPSRPADTVWQRLPPWLAEQIRMTMSDHETVVLEGTVSR